MPITVLRSLPWARRFLRAAQGVCESPEVLVCKLIDDKITYVHRRLWPALVKLAPRFRKAQLAKVWNEHTESGAHLSRRTDFPDWVPAEIMKQAEALSTTDAEQLLAVLLARQPVKKGAYSKAPSSARSRRCSEKD